MNRENTLKNARLLLSGLSLVALIATGCGLNPSSLSAGGVQRTAAVHVRAKAVKADYYAAAEGKTGTALLQALKAIVGPHTDLGYDRARDVMFGDVDDADNDNVVECVYIGQDLPGITDRRTAYKNGQGLNAEHTWPQSKGAEGVAKADLNHLFPANCKANSTRSSFPFGEVKSVQWEEGGSKLGTDANGHVVFEPRDEHKGNVARAILYFYTVYGQNGGVSLDNFKIEEETLKRWHVQDPVNAGDKTRNDLVMGAQGNRNPYIDHPEYVGAVGKFLNLSAARR